jgi:hypothetical protein
MGFGFAVLSQRAVAASSRRSRTMANLPKIRKAAEIVGRSNSHSVSSSFTSCVSSEAVSNDGTTLEFGGIVIIHILCVIGSNKLW